MLVRSATLLLAFSCGAAFAAGSASTTSSATAPTVTVGGSCATPPIRCCESVQADTPQTQQLLLILGVHVPPSASGGLVGLGCESLPSGDSCPLPRSAVCCGYIYLNGEVAAGCAPVVA
ncbi:hypothetical protein PsYK624_121080 [Phanerochaete sordida]|uniref:Hydrophobin n=1 Tax=Phanerochaete sordida TaxID=48140 RepID=A0A9P3GHX1_9APHY|nr:hypothetical protein PsYK624_121080 [Phanerochaete sordida]